MPMDFSAAKMALDNIRVRREYGSTIATPNGKTRLVVGAGLHSETLDCFLVIFDPETSDFTAIVPGAARETDERLEMPADFNAALINSTHRHKKGGVYTQLARVRSRDGEMVVYASHADRIWWLRPSAMFDDGRFETSTEPPLVSAELGF